MTRYGPGLKLYPVEFLHFDHVNALSVGLEKLRRCMEIITLTQQEFLGWGSRRNRSHGCSSARTGVLDSEIAAADSITAPLVVIRHPGDVVYAVGQLSGI